MAETKGIICGNCGWPVDAECGCPEPDPLPRVTKEDVEALAVKDIEPMDDARLDAIEARAKEYMEGPLDGEFTHVVGGQVICQDVPALVAEVRRLRKNIADAVYCLADMARNPEPGGSTRRRPRRCRLGCHCPKCTRVIG